MNRVVLGQLGSYGLAAVLVLFLSGATIGVSPEVVDVDVPHPIARNEAGSWTQNGTTSTWTYAIRIPSAVSMSFHASAAYLPPSGVLTVAGINGVVVSYRAGDIARSGLWSRPLAGDSLLLSLTLSTAERPRVALQIDSFQAGYRGLGGNLEDHPYYRHLMKQATQLSSCSVNYSCAATSANQGPAHATVAIVIGNVVQCTGTLVNDTSGDAIPYVLTARHCENGVLGGGDPAAAESVTVYWDAVTACGTPLGSIYDGSALTQNGATTIVEQQDAWLIQLDTAPAASDAYLAGWDATGGVFSGGYSIHHALGYDRQYVGWYGQAILQNFPAATLNLKYASTLWGVVNGQGNVGAGASGGALFDQNNNAVGSASLAYLPNGPNTAGVCPVTPTAAPTPSTVTAQYTALSAVWGSTEDTTSSTGSTTLQSALDAAKTGQLVTTGAGCLPIALSVDRSSPGTGQSINLTWSAPKGQACTASGGLSGDGWIGSHGASGTLALTEQSAGQVIYVIHCTGPGLIGSASVTVTWQLIPAVVNLTGSGPTAAAGRLVLLQWFANTGPCAASGGISADGWAGAKTSSGSQSVLASALGSTTYTLTCGSGGRTATSQYTINVVAPSAGQIGGDANQLRAGQSVTLQFTGGGACVASGGAAGDGWAGPLATSSQDAGVLQYTVPVTESVAGTYTYTVTCSGAGATGSLSSSSSITLTFTGAAPSASLSASPTPVEIYTDPGAYNSVLNLSWSSNVRPCSITYVGPGNVQGAVTGLDAGLPTGTAQDDEQVAGAYVYTIRCGTGPSLAQSSASITWFTNAPAVSLNVANPVPLGSGAAVGWQSNVFPCIGTGGGAGDGWAGSKAGAIGYQTVTESALGTVTFGITCGTGSQTVQAQSTTTVTAPSVSITASASTLPVNGALQLHWNSNFEPCTSSINPGNGNWGTVLPMTGGFQTTQYTAGTYTYTIICAGIQASTQVTFTGSLMDLTASASSAIVNTPIILSWSSPAGTTSCTATGGSGSDAWTGTIASAGSITVTSPSAATIGYSISCNLGSGASQAMTQVTYVPVTTSQPAAPTPSLTLMASVSTQVVGKSVTLDWTSKNAIVCAASGGTSDDGWSGSLPLSGTKAITESTASEFTYGITCSGAPPSASAQAVVDFTAGTVTISGSSGAKSGGGGALDPYSLLLLGLLACRQVRRRHGEVAVGLRAGVPQSRQWDSHQIRIINNF
jgi:hypothetical protein